MRRSEISALVGYILIVACGGCAPEAYDTTGTDGLLTLVAGLTESRADEAELGQAGSGPIILSGSVAVPGSYELITLGAASAGERWRISHAGDRSSGSYLVVLLDADYNLLYRQLVTTTAPLEHVLRSDSGLLHVGVASPYASRGVSFRVSVESRTGNPVPAPSAQVVWLNFGGASGVSVHGQAPVSFGAFDGGSVAPEYAGLTATMKAAIIETMREDYAGFDVEIRSSDEGGPPAGPHATVHFGGTSARLLGLADNVDQYNEDPWQAAIIYTDEFQDFAVMQLTAEEMGHMLGNVASHELGHLLGLFHTQVATDVMDTTGTAWDIAGAQRFSRAALETSVFPYGFEDSPARLRETVGVVAVEKSGDLAKAQTTEKMQRKALLRARVQDELRGRCGTCLHLDD